MEEQTNGDGSGKLVVILIVVGFVAYILLHIMALIGVLLVVGATAASVYFGFKFSHQVAMESELWESRKIQKHKRMEAELQREADYFRGKGYERVANFVEGQSENMARKLYEEKNRFDETLNAVKKVKEVFRKEKGDANRPR